LEKKKVKEKGDFFFKPAQNETVAGRWPTQSRWMNCPPSKMGLVQSGGAGSLKLMKLSLPPKLVEKLVWVPVISFCKIFIPSYTFDDALLC
jgi:hypothetical protein